MSRKDVNAHSKIPNLLAALDRAGWGDLGAREHQGLRTVLKAIGNIVNWTTGGAIVTVSQVASAACLSEKWTRRRLYQLEELGVIEWTRGGAVNGEPVPGRMRIVKTVLVELIRVARPMKDAADTARRVATRARIAGLRFVRWSNATRTGGGRKAAGRGSGRFPRSDRPELSAYLLSPTEEEQAAHAPAGDSATEHQAVQQAMNWLPPVKRAARAAEVRAEIRKTRKVGRPSVAATAIPALSLT